MEGERRHQSDHAFGRAHGSFGKDLVLLDLRATILIDPARDALDLTARDRARDCLRADAGLAQFLRAHHRAFVEQAFEPLCL